LTQLQGVLVEQRQAAEKENISLQAKLDEEKAQIQQGKEQFLTKLLEVKEAFNRELRSMTFVEIKAKDRVTQQV
jgi:molecular chaperone GrpE (heat shock protein)